jgi:hypothetical protein
MSVALVLLAVDGHRRATFVREACARLAWDPPRIVSWSEALDDAGALHRALDDACCARRRGRARAVWLRFDSPGEHWETERRLLRRGARVVEPIDGHRALRASEEEVERLRFDRGRITLPRQWFLGFAEALRSLEAVAHQHPGVRLTSAADDVVTLFDKRATHERLAAASVRTAPLLGCPRDSDELRALMRDRDVSRVFVKLWHGSSASGVVALRWDDRSIAATTSVELARFGDETRLYNSLRVRRYTDERDARAVLDALLREGAVVEAWMPKATYDGDNFDLRVVTIAGRARHAVVRVGRAPMTNLHLGNRRGDLERVRARLGDERWRDLARLCESVASAFNRCASVGVDVMLSHDWRVSRVLEANAFGDLLPNVEHEGEDTYTATLRSLK